MLIIVIYNISKKYKEVKYTNQNWSQLSNQLTKINNKNLKKYHLMNSSSTPLDSSSYDWTAEFFPSSICLE